MFIHCFSEESLDLLMESWGGSVQTHQRGHHTAATHSLRTRDGRGPQADSNTKVHEASILKDTE